MADFETKRQEFEAEFKITPSDDILRAIEIAANEANRMRHNDIGTEHFLLSLVQEPLTRSILESLGIDLAKARTATEFIIGFGDGTLHPDQIKFTPKAKKVIEFGAHEARKQNNNPLILETEDLLLGLIREEGGFACGILQSLGVGLDQVRTAVIQARIDRAREQELEAG